MKEIKPVCNNIIVDVYDENPYKVAKTEDGLDLTDTFVNSDSGQVEEKQLVIECAKVLEVGPECLYVRPDNDVMVDVRTMTPIPFMGRIIWLVNEHAIKAVIGDDLEEQFKK